MRCVTCSVPILLAAFLSLDSGAAPQSGKQTHPLTVTGRALDVCGRPIAGANVFLISTFQFETVLGETTTDADGRYAFSELPLPIPVMPDWDIRDNGHFQVFGGAKGCALAWSKILRLCLDLDKKAVRKADDRVYFPGEKIELDLRFESPYPVSGRFVDERGTPLAGVKVTLTSCEAADAKRRPAGEFHEMRWLSLHAARLMPEKVVVSSDADGRFRLNAVPADKNCWLNVEHPEYADTGARWIVTGSNPPVIDGPNRPAKLPLNVTLRSTRVVPVQITWADTGLPAAKVRLNTGKQMPFPSYHDPAVSDQEGRIGLRLPTGTYHLSADPPRDSKYLPTYRKIRIDDQPAEQPVALQVQQGCVLILKAIDAESGRGIAGGSFWSKDPDQPGSAPVRVQSSPGTADNPMTDSSGSLRAVVPPGIRHFGVDFEMLPEYLAADPEEFSAGRRLELPAGETVIVEFKLLRRPDDIAATAGVPVAVSGTVIFDGSQPVQKTIQPRKGPPVLDESLLVDAETGGVANVVIFLEKVPSGVLIPPAPKARAKLSITGRQFVPRVSAVRTGRPTIVTNDDPEPTNVNAQPIRNTATNRVLAPGDSLYWKYGKPERRPVRMQSDIHSWMKAWQIVTDHPWVAITDKTGKFALRGLPPGVYQFTVWHESPGILERNLQVEVKAGGATELNLHYPAARFGR